MIFTVMRFFMCRVKGVAQGCFFGSVQVGPQDTPTMCAKPFDHPVRRFLARHDEKRRLILDRAARLFADEGYDRASVSSVAIAA